MFVTNWISTTKIQKISEITNFFRHYFLSRTEVSILPPDHGRSNPARMTDISGMAVFDWNSAFATCGCLHF